MARAAGAGVAQLRQLRGITKDNFWRDCRGGVWERLVLPVERGGGAGRDRSEGVADGSMPKAGLSAVQTGWLVANVPLYTHIKKDKAAHKHGAYSAKALQMADEIGFMNFLGNKQLEAYVARKRKEFFASVAGVAAAAVAAAKVASEKQTDDGAAGSDSEMATVE